MKLRAGPAREGRIPLMGGWEGFKVVHRRPDWVIAHWMSRQGLLHDSILHIRQVRGDVLASAPSGRCGRSAGWQWAGIRENSADRHS